MLDQMIAMEPVWRTVQDQARPVDGESPSLLLRSALDTGWRMVRRELVPCWDQHGVVHLVLLQTRSGMFSQRLILPDTPVVRTLLREYTLRD